MTVSPTSRGTRRMASRSFRSGYSTNVSMGSKRRLCKPHERIVVDSVICPAHGTLLGNAHLTSVATPTALWPESRAYPALPAPLRKRSEIVEFQQMPHLFPLRAEIGKAGVEHVGQAGNALHNLHPGLLHGFHLFGVVGHQADRFQAEELQDGAGQFVIAEIAIEAQLLISFDGIGAAVLQFVGAQRSEERR